MYLDHRVTVKIARILNMIDLSALLLDNSGSVILPEGDPRVLNLPEAIRTNPTMPLVYGGFTLIGTSEDQPVFICLTGDSEDVKKCAVLCAELINMMLREDMSQTNREQSLRMMLRGEVETSEFETLAAEHAKRQESEVKKSKKDRKTVWKPVDLSEGVATRPVRPVQTVPKCKSIKEIQKEELAKKKEKEKEAEFTQSSG